MTTTILVIDDSVDDQLLYQRAFKDFGHSFILIMVASAEAGFARIADTGPDAIRPDLILLDYNLPEMDGLSFMRLLPAYSSTPIPIIMLTGQGNAEVAVEAMKNGVDDYIIKDVEGRYLKLLPGVAGHVMAAHRQRQRVQQLHQETEKLLLRNQILMQNSMDGIHVMDMQGNLVEGNQAFCDMLGYSREEAARLNVADWDAQWSAEELRERFRQLVGQRARFETVHRRKDGTLIDVEISSSGMEIEGQCFLFASSRDITERKKTEALLRQHTSIIDTSIDGFWLADMKGYLLEANEAYAKISGYSVEELAGMHISQLEAIEQSPEAVQAHVEKVVAQGYDRFETRHRHKDGHEIDIEISTTYIAEARWLAVFCHDISRRKQDEAALLNREANLRAMLDNSPYLTWLKDVEGRYVAANKVFSDYLRLEDARQVTGKTDLDLWPAELANKYRADDAEVMAGRKRKQIEERTLDGDTLLWVETFKTPVVDVHGNVLGTVGFARDITDRKKNEEEMLLESETERKRATVMAQRFGHLLQSSFNEIYLFDADSLRFIQTSEGAQKNLGYAADELEQLTSLALNPSYTRERFDALIAPLRSGERSSLLFESIHYRKDGTDYPVEVRLQLMEAEFPVFLAIVQDISERKTAEERLRFHSRILKSLAEGICLIRVSDGVIVYSNPQFERMFAYGPGELFGMHVSKINAPGVRTPAEVADEINEQLERKGIWTGEVNNIRKDGKTFWCRISVSTFEHFQFGKVWVSVHEDISEQKYAEQQARELSVHLQTVREEERASFAREIHDELGGTLAALKMDACWLKDKLDGERKLKPLQECALSMVGLLDSAVLATRRIITDLRPALLDDLGLLETLKWQSAQFYKRTGIECKVVRTGEEGREAGLDKMQSINLFRIFQESLTNVARHSGASRVEVDLRQENEEVVLTISDNGCGLPEGQPIAPTSYGMRGMRERVMQLDGQIIFGTPPGGGLSVTVRLPLLAENEKIHDY